MNMLRIASVLAIVALASACATTDPARQPRAEFDDIPIPSGLAYIEGGTMIIDAPGAKVARLLYRGRITMAGVSSIMRANLEGTGWRKVGSSVMTAQGTTQVYEKDRSSLQVRVWENPIFTYVELTASRLTTDPGPAAMTSTPVPAEPPR